LGRGLGALIPTGPAEEDALGARLEEIDLDAIEPNPRQPREVFDPDALAELVASIQAVGVLQPVVVRELDSGRYQLVMGERRWRATREAGLSVIPAIVRETADDDLLRDALLENLHRQQLNALEEAAAYQQLLTEFGTTHEQLADRIGRSRSHVSNTLRLLNLAPAVQRRVAAGVLSAGHARALLGLEDHNAQERLADRIIAEGLSVRSAEELVTVAEPVSSVRARRPRAQQPAELTALAELLSEALDTRVTIDLGRRRGKLVVEFATMEDLERVLGQLAPGALVSPGGADAGDGAGSAGDVRADGAEHGHEGRADEAGPAGDQQAAARQDGHEQHGEQSPEQPSGDEHQSEHQSGEHHGDGDQSQEHHGQYEHGQDEHGQGHDGQGHDGQGHDGQGHDGQGHDGHERGGEHQGHEHHG
jgi:ParB family chromosome partitioning protein